MQLNNKSKQSNLGIGLVEVILALGLTIMVVTSLVSLSLYVLRSSLQSKLLLVGTKYVSSEIEMVRSLRDNQYTTWLEFLDLVKGCFDQNVCYVSNVTTPSISNGPRQIGSGAELVTVYFTAFVANSPDSYVQISTTNPGLLPQVIRIKATAEWTIAGATKSTTVYTDLANWRGK